MLTVEPFVSVDMAQLAMNFDQRYALYIQTFITARTSQSAGAGIRVFIFSHSNDAVVRSREDPLVHASCDVITVLRIGALT